MSNVQHLSPWSTLPLLNPFLRPKGARPLLFSDDASETMSGYVSGRVPEILEIIGGRQSAFILEGTPHIGKSSLIDYLQDNSSAWSWRDELAPLQDELAQADIHLDAIHFVQVNLTYLETLPLEELKTIFEQQCVLGIQSVYRPDGEYSSIESTKFELRDLLQRITKNQPNNRYFVMLDSIERLGRVGTQSLKEEYGRQTDRDRGLAILEQGQIIQTLVELHEEFSNFGVILSIESLPGPTIDHQFCQVSVNLSSYLARFEPIIIKTLTWENAQLFVQQVPESGGSSWAKRFRNLYGDYIFSNEEQEWLLEQAGTHLYLLHHYCFHAFNTKQKEAGIQSCWSTLDDNSKISVLEKVNERLSTFFVHLWNRLQEALAVSNQEQENRKKFRDFLLASGANKKIDSKVWKQLGPELRYILTSEGIVCLDQLERVRYPGAVLLNYLTQKMQDEKDRSVSTTIPSTRGFWLKINFPYGEPKRLSLSELEYGIMQTLLRHEEPSTQDILMMEVWGKNIDKTTFNQRIYHLRKKLRDCYKEEDLIENQYGGYYTLHNHEWFQLE